jgi:hypothetical protein
MICDMCKEDKPDVLKRYGPIGQKRWPGTAHENPDLCAECCSLAPGREWMRKARDTPPAEEMEILDL